jgi:uncharacterized protein YeeX (DUF496 family)
VHANIPLRAKGKNHTAFRINTYIMKMLLLSLVFKYIRDDSTLQLVQEILDNKKPKFSIRTDNVAVGSSIEDTEAINDVSIVTSGLSET